MKLSKVASVVAALLATDAKPTEAQIIAACLAADKKGKDGSPLGEAGVEAKNEARDEDMPEGMDAKAWDAMSPEEKKEAKDKAKDKARDEKDDPEKTNDADPDCAKDDIQPAKSAGGNGGNGGKETAQDTAAVVKAALDARDALHAARRAVEPVLGVVAYDSAAKVYKAALDKLGVDTAGVHASAYPALYKMACDKIAAETPRLASDAAVVTTMAKLIPGYNRLPAR